MIESNAEKDGRVVSPAGNDFVAFENTLRPKTLEEYVGQKKIKDNLSISIMAADKRGEPLDHILLHGAPGLGKTTLAHVIAHEADVNIRITSGPALEKQGDIASIISTLKDNDILFIDEIHRLKPIVEEILYTAMEDYAIDLVIGNGPSAKTVRLQLPKFTLIGATTKVSMLSSPLRDRFGNIFRLDFYEETDISDIILRSAKILDFAVTQECADELSKSCRKTPRIANRLLKRVRDYAEVKHEAKLSIEILNKALRAIGVDETGLDQIDRQILETIMLKFRGGPVGLNTLSAATNEDQSTVEDVYEPFLIQMGFLERTSRGRIATPRAYQHLNIPDPQAQKPLQI